jgi:dTDP-4-amino-4,6-dideoxygalactose transaminase
MHILSLPRHQLETTLADYAGIVGAFIAKRGTIGAVEAFERQFAEYIGCRHAIAISSGRLGMHLILEALNVQPGDEAVVPSFNLFAVVERFCQLGIVPRFCDVRACDLNIDPAKLDRVITPRTRILLATHMFGHPAQVEALTALARRHNLVLLEDCAHALGTRFAGRFVGVFGKASIFSFSVLKLVTTFGGGMIATNEDDLALRIRARLSQFRRSQPKVGGIKKALIGATMDFATRRAAFSFAAWPMLRVMRTVRPNAQRQIMTETPRVDRNFDPSRVPPLHPFQARLGAGQLGRVDEIIERRRTVGRWLDEALSGVPQISLLRTAEGGAWNGLYYGILADRAAELAEYLFRRGIDCETSEYRNCADLDLYRGQRDDCPVGRKVQSRILRLPNFPAMRRCDAQRVATAVRRFYATRPEVHDRGAAAGGT